MMVVSHLRSFQALELALRTGSLKGAADLLGITPAAVGQRIKALEDYLGIDLVVRGRSGLRPTATLSLASAHLTNAFRELGAAAEALDLQRVNEIQIAANSDWVELWLAPRLAKFRAAHPNTRFCINGEGDAPMRLGQTDIEIRFRDVSSEENSIVLFYDFLVPVSSPVNAERIGKLDKKTRLEGFPLLHLDFYKDDPGAIGWTEWIKAHGQHRSASQRGIIRFQRIAPGLQAVLSDAGLMICGLALITDRLERGELTLPFPVSTGAWTRQAFQARFRRDTIVRPQVRRFRQWLEEEAQETAKNLRRIAKSAPNARRSAAKVA
jgi:LysR family glycine cleavage system transcriptional activator